MGGIAGAGSGDLFLAFSTGKTGTPDSSGVASVSMLDDERIDPVYEATVQATEDAIPALPHDRLRALLQKYGRLRR
jgi:L-aminopeptidase/D-esterase-like protein